MSKKKHSELAKKKHNKSIKRKNKVRKFNANATVEERLSVRINRAIHQPRTRQYKEIPVEELLNQAKQRVKDLRFIHYYLIFAKILCEKNLIAGKLNYDVVKTTLTIKSINEALLAIPKLEEDNAIQIELFDVGEKLSALSVEMNKFVLLLEPYQSYIGSTIMTVGKKLPEKEDGTPYEKWEVENEVLRTYAIEYIAEHVYHINTVKGDVNE